MDVPEKGNNNTVWIKAPAQTNVPLQQSVPFYKYDTREFKKFFDFTGGSIFYCLSAVFVIYGIVNVMGPVLSKGEALKNALPCIFTLHGYELALLGVLILIVSKKVVDDAISVLILTALFLVGTSVALGSVADTGIKASLWLGLLGTVLAFIKFLVMRRFAAISFKLLSILGLIVIITCNYFGPAFMANTVLSGQTLESVRRGHWWLIWLVMLASAGLVLAEAMRSKARENKGETARTPFLQSPVMVYLFSLVIIAASGAHQYAMSYSNGLQRAIGDYIPIIAIAAFILLEIIRLTGMQGKHLAVISALISCFPLVIMLFAIEEKSILSNNELGLGLFGYPPFISGLTGIIIVFWSLYHRQYLLMASAILYGLGVILTFGFSPEHPYDLNFKVCLGTLIIILIICGLVKRNQYLCIAAAIALCFGLYNSNSFYELMKSYQLTLMGGNAGIFGLYAMFLVLFFGTKLNSVFRFIGALSLLGFAFDYMPNDFHWRYAIVLAGIIVISIILWFRVKDIWSISILWIPVLIKLYMASKNLAYWRAVIVGFLLLGAGVAASMFKRRMRERESHQTNDVKVPLAGPAELK